MRETKRAQFIFDSSSPHVFLHASGKHDLTIHKRFEKRGLGADFPAYFSEIAAELELAPDTTVFLGGGPGSFTGIKTGAAFISAYLFSNNIVNVNIVSSLDIYSLCMPSVDSLYIVVAPFNKKEFFISMYEMKEGCRHYLTRDAFAGFDELAVLINSISHHRDAYFTAVTPVSDELKNMLSEKFEHLAVSPVDPVFDASRIDEIEVIRSLDISRDPMMLNYVVSPANLKGDHTAFYLSLQKEEV